MGEKDQSMSEIQSESRGTRGLSDRQKRPYMRSFMSKLVVQSGVNLLQRGGREQTSSRELTEKSKITEKSGGGRVGHPNG
ncbi:hypothetical protein TNCT_19071 [Trichonephila clavata]|uniref:Uncharacterized protein n=1 Tax=Trichonephila clavata TaxID=2740835 RepID=A0A8X6J5R1_TRICU|nr:hypothetical protein TNCT_19071 [Trichonephila clavata]